ncbi:MAG: LPS export ABC transporter permease LptF [Desulfobacterales bacterium]|nr:LPS export ABC transporter permease LptF [Desulfobacterales bacterium]
MKFNTIINRYIFKELIPPFVINLFFLTFIFLMTKILDITNLVVNYKVSLWAIVLMLIYSMPFFLEFVIPMSVMMAVLLTFLRLSSDNEIVALKAGGCHIYRLLPPVFLFAFIGWALTSFMAIYALPWGKLSLKELSFKVISSNIDIGLKERTFSDSFDGVMLYVNQVDLKNKALVDVFIEDQRTPNLISTVVASKGRLFSNPQDLQYRLRLYNGTINQVDMKSRSAHSINFDTYDITLDIKRMAQPVRGGGDKDEEEMDLAELRHYLKNTSLKNDQYYLTLMEFHKKFSIPFACFALGLLAVPLGIHSRSARRSYGVGLGLVFFLSYYILLSAGWVFGEAGVYPPLIGMWVPNVVMGGIGFFLLRQTARERTFQMNFLSRLIKKRERC